MWEPKRPTRPPKVPGAHRYRRLVFAAVLASLIFGALNYVGGESIERAVLGGIGFGVLWGFLMAIFGRRRQPH